MKKEKLANASLIVVATLLSQTVSAQTIDFNSPPFTAGAGLNGQQNWLAESSWNVDVGGGSVSTDTNAEIAVLNTPVTLAVGETFSYYVEFRYTGTYAVPTGNLSLFQTGLNDSTGLVANTAANTDAHFNVQAFGTNQDQRLLVGFTNISGDNNLDPIDTNHTYRIEYEITLGIDAASTNYVGRFDNISTGQDGGDSNFSGIDTSIYDALTGSGAYVYFQSLNPAANASGLTGVEVGRVAIIPEPKVYSLIVAAGAFLFVHLRKKQSRKTSC
ncbi:MAG: hypothetical protein AAFX93_11215 [Verrucomicrobiota bacterium]